MRALKAEDFDTSAWTKALARSVASTVRDTVQPQQLGVSGGVGTLDLGLMLCFVQQIANGVTAVAVSVDLKNAHNSFSQPRSAWGLPRRRRPRPPPCGLL